MFCKQIDSSPTELNILSKRYLKSLNTNTATKFLKFKDVRPKMVGQIKNNEEMKKIYLFKLKVGFS